MKTLFSGNAIWQLVLQSDTMTWFVYIILLLMSLACWSVFFYKLINWRIRFKNLKTAIIHIKNADDLDDVLHTSSKLANTLPGYFLSRVLAKLKLLLGPNKENLNDQKWDFLQNYLDQTLDNIVQKERSFLSVLSVSAAVAPLLGLFGTIWGLVHAFVDISQKQVADIATIAPGIAEALMTTLAGLMVAIPAVVMFYYLSNKVIEIDLQAENLSDRFMMLVQKLFSKTGE